jgi:hypothetical protein
MIERREPPVRLCCGLRHDTVQCPDGLVMCCLCFSRFPVSDLHVTEDGSPEDVCAGCAAAEQKEIERRRLA